MDLRFISRFIKKAINEMLNENYSEYAMRQADKETGQINIFDIGGVTDD